MSLLKDLQDREITGKKIPHIEYNIVEPGVRKVYFRPYIYGDQSNYSIGAFTFRHSVDSVIALAKAMRKYEEPETFIDVITACFNVQNDQDAETVFSLIFCAQDVRQMTFSPLSDRDLEIQFITLAAADWTMPMFNNSRVLSAEKIQAAGEELQRVAEKF